MLIGVLASHGGTNLQAIIDACASGALDADVAVVISNSSRARALARARQAGLPGYHLSTVTHPLPEDLDRAIAETLAKHGVDLVVLAGYMRLLGPRTLAQYTGRILNIHPALLPKFGGQGMYGDRVHEAVLAAGDMETGVTIHVADEEYDRGPTVAQRRVPVLEGDTVESLRERVLEQEHQLLVETLQKIAQGEIDLAQLRTDLVCGPAR